MIGSSILNSIYFLDTSGSYPNWQNTKHDLRKHGSYYIIHYHQRFNLNNVVTVQFYSDSATVPTLKSYYGATEIEEITLTLINTIEDRYYYQGSITLDSDYLNKDVTFTLVQDSDTLYSEYVRVEDLTEDIANGVIKRIDYYNNDTFKHFLDFSSITENLFIYIESQDREIKDEDNIENMKGSQSYETTAASLFVGQLLKTDALPTYRTRQLEAITSLDVYTINDLQYIKQSGVEPEPFGNSTSFQNSITLIQKNAIGLNVDDLGIISDEMEWHKPDKFRGVSASVDAAVPADYMIHTVFIRHSSGSSGGPVAVTIGSSSGGTQYYDNIGGEIRAGRNNFPIHDGAKTGASIGRVYIGISASAGVKLDIDILYEYLP